MDGREGSAGIERLVDHGQAAIGFMVGAVSTGQIMKVADAEQLLPAKVMNLFLPFYFMCFYYYFLTLHLCAI